MGAVLAGAQLEDGVTHVVHRDHQRQPQQAGVAGGTARAAGSVLGMTAAGAGESAEIGSPVSLATTMTVDPSADAAAGGAECVVLGVSGKEALVHYRRHPDSYDTWLSVATATQSAAPGSNLTSPPPKKQNLEDHLGLLSARGSGGGPTHVLASWLVDSARFNEWCAEEDYEWEDPTVTAMKASKAGATSGGTLGSLDDEGGGGGASAEAAGEKRKAADGEPTGGQGPGPAKAARREGGEHVAPPQFAERVAPNLIRRQLVTPHRAVAVAAGGDGGGGSAAVVAAAAAATAAAGGTGAGPDEGATHGKPAAPVVQENISHGQRPVAAAQAAAVAAATAAVQPEAAVAAGGDAMDVDGSTKTEKVALESNAQAQVQARTPAPQPPPHPEGGEVYRVPGHSAWFRWDAVHVTERKGLPEFFTGASGTKTPATYHAYRCAMMNQYRALVPGGGRLVFTAARRGLVGDVNTLQRIFDFLERWGLINWQTSTAAAVAAAAADGKDKAAGGVSFPRVVTPGVVVPQAPTPGTNAAAAAALYRFAAAPGNGAATIAAAAAAAAAADAEGDTGGVRLGRPPKIPVLPTAVEAPLSTHAVLYKAQLEVDRECASCATCLRGAGRVYYHCAQLPRAVAAALVVAAAATSGGAGGAAVIGTGGLDLCGRCFTDGRLPDGTTSTSFLRTIVAGSAAPGDKGREGDDDADDEEEEDMDWSDQETLLLLEGLEVYGESWTDVAEHVGTKSIEECIRHFIRLPIEDRFLDDIGAGVGVGGRAVRGGGMVGPGGGASPQGGGEPAPWFGRLGEPDPDALLLGPDAATTPFAGAPNPVMANVAFLAACVGPRVAAAAARAALQALSEELEEEGGGSGGDNARNDAEAKAKAKARDELATAAAEMDTAAETEGNGTNGGCGGEARGGELGQAAGAIGAGDDDDDQDLGPAPLLSVAQVRSTPLNPKP